MRRTSFAAFAVAAIMLTFAALPALAQSAGGDMPMRTPDGHPDISGTFTFRTLTPMQRPAQFEGLETLGPEAAAAFEASERTRQNRDLFDPETGAPNAGYQSRADGGVLSYNEFWYERGIELTSDKRTSLIVDPPDGRYPPLTDSQPGRPTGTGPPTAASTCTTPTRTGAQATAASCSPSRARRCGPGRTTTT